MNPLQKIKEKREFRTLPESVIKKSYDISKGDIKESRALLRKYFGIFLTNKVLKKDLKWELRLKNHISSKNRNYEEFYNKIAEKISVPETIVDLGCGANGFSYSHLNKIFENVNYIGVEAVGEIVDQTNKYFKKEDFNAKIFHEDLFDFKKILKILKGQKQKRVIFLFQVIDALESLEKDFSKKFISEISKESEEIVITLPTKSIGGRKSFQVQRKWLVDFLEDNFQIVSDFKIGLERTIIIKKGENRK